MPHKYTDTDGILKAQNTAFRLRPVYLESLGTSSLPRRRYSCKVDIYQRLNTAFEWCTYFFLPQNPIPVFDTFPFAVLLPLALSLS